MLANIPATQTVIEIKTPGGPEALARRDNGAVVVNLDIEPVERPEQVRCVDPIHPDSRSIGPRADPRRAP